MNLFLIIVFLTSLLVFGEALAENPDVGACTGCHGLDGRSRQEDYPNLAGQKQRYLEKALKDFRNGSRHHLMMNFVAKDMSDENIESFAAYYAGFQ